MRTQLLVHTEDLSRKWIDRMAALGVESVALHPVGGPAAAKTLARTLEMLARLTDGREVLIPVSFFPDIQHMPVKEREKWMVLDDQYFTFENMPRVYSVLDLMRVA